VSADAVSHRAGSGISLALVPALWGIWNMLWIGSTAHPSADRVHGAVFPFLLLPAGAMVARCLGILVLGTYGVTWFQTISVPYALIVRVSWPRWRATTLSGSTSLVPSTACWNCVTVSRLTEMSEVTVMSFRNLEWLFPIVITLHNVKRPSGFLVGRSGLASGRLQSRRVSSVLPWQC